MEQILQNLADPSWWFTGTFFVVLGIILTKLLFSWIPKVWRKISIIRPALSRKIYRWKERKILLKIKRYRQHEVRINLLIGRYWCLATVTIIYMGFLMISFVFSSTLIQLKNLNFLELKKITLLLPVVVPAYFLAIVTMWEKRILFRAISAHIRWNKRITKRLSKDVLTHAA